jgi:DNA-binding PadR family transcriptional regulator
VAHTEEPTAESFLPLNPNDYLLLFSLTDQERHGYGLVKHIAELTGETVTLDPANLHRVLKRMVKQGLVIDAQVKPTGETGHERRRYYAVTTLGRKVAAAEATRMRLLARSAEAHRLISRSRA